MALVQPDLVGVAAGLAGEAARAIGAPRAGVALRALGALGPLVALGPLWPLRAGVALGALCTGVAGVALWPLRAGVTLGAVERAQEVADRARVALGQPLLVGRQAGRAVLAGTTVLARRALRPLVALGALGAVAQRHRVERGEVDRRPAELALGEIGASDVRDPRIAGVAHRPLGADGALRALGAGVALRALWAGGPDRAGRSRSGGPANLDPNLLVQA